MAPTLVLFLHGFTLTGASWDPVVGALDPQRYRAFTPDIRGHGSESAADPVTLDAVLGDFAALVEAISQLSAAVDGVADPPLTLVGYSQGGRIALHLALALGPRITRVFLIGASPGIADPVERAVRRAADAQLADEIEAMSIEAFADRWAQTPVLAGQAPEVLAAAHADRLRSTPAGLAAALRGLGTGALPSLWDRLGEIESPVTLIVGERDTKFGAVALEMAPAFRDAEVLVAPGVGHAVALEAPELVAEIIAGGAVP